MHDDRVHPGYPDYVQEIERVRQEMAMDGASHEEVNAWEAATLEAGAPVISKMTRTERLTGLNLRDDVEHKTLLMKLYSKGVISTKTLGEKLGIEWNATTIAEIIPIAASATANNYTVTATTATTTSTWNLNLSGNGYVISYVGPGCSMETEPEPILKPRQWRGEVHGRVRFK